MSRNFSFKNLRKGHLLLVLWILVICLIYLHTTDAFDQDLGRHLKLGEIIWETKEVPKTNLFSYTNPDEPVFNSHWGSQVIFYSIHKAFGINGLIFLNTIVNTAAFGLLFFFATRRAGIVIPSLIFMPFVFLLLDRTWIRPEMFGNLFYALLLVCLFSKRVREWLKWFFPIIALLWINLHITAVVGVFMMGVVLLQDTVGGIRENVIIGVLILLALQLNPYGIEGVLTAFTVLGKYGYTIVENQSWLFLRDFGFPLVGHIFFGFFALLISFFIAFYTKRKPLIGEIILLVVISFLTLRYVRNEVLLTYTVFLTAGFNLGGLGRWPGGPLARRGLAGVLGALIIAIFVIISTHNSQGLPVGLGSRESYKNGIDFFQDSNLKGPIFNNFDIGGYLIYRMYPKELVFVDNRPEAYPIEFFQDIYKPMQFDRATFDKFVEKYQIKTIVWGRRDITDWSIAFLSWLPAHPDWEQVYIDNAITIFVKYQK